MSEFERPELQDPTRRAEIEDVLGLAAAATPHFALHLRNRILRLVEGLDPSDPARQLADSEIARLELLAVEGQRQGRTDDLPHIYGGNGLTDS